MDLGLINQECTPVTTRPTFDITPHYESYLPTAGTLVDVIATVRGTQDAPSAGQPVEVSGGGRFAEVILLDCSGSMGMPVTKLFQARRAAAAAVDALRDGVHFAVVAGTHQAEMIYPERPMLVEADARRRAAAKRALQRVAAGGGTAMSTWLRRADQLFAGQPGTIRHAILLTDGRNESEPVRRLDEALAECASRFTVDCRAIPERPGVHAWRGTELLRIADALGANPVVPVEDLDRLVAEFTTVIAAAMRQGVGDVRLRLRTSALATVRFVKQVHPTIADLTELAQPVDELTVDYPVGAWGDGHRDYHVGIQVRPMDAGESRRVAWISLMVPTSDGTLAPGADEAEEVGHSAIAVQWTEEMALYTGINATVAHYTRQQDIAALIRAAWEAFDERRLGDAETLMGKAVTLAYEAGAHDKLEILARVVDIKDAAKGLVRLRSDVDPGRWQVPTVTGHHTDVWRPPAGRGTAVGEEDGPTPGRDDGVPAPSVAGGGAEVVPDEACPRCQAQRRARYCERCGYDFHAGPVDGT